MDLPELLFSTTGPLVGASYTDVHARLPGLHVAAVGRPAGRRRRSPSASSADGRAGTRSRRSAATSSSRSLARGAYPALVQKLVVAPTELHARAAVPRPATSQATRRAWGLDRVTIGDLRGEATLTLDDVAREPRDDRQRAAVGPRAAAPDLRAAPGDPHVLRLRLGRRRPLPASTAQLPPGPALGARAELGVAADAHASSTSTSPSRTAWALTLGPVERGDGRGAAGAVHQGPAAARRASTLRITRPQIYFGELSNDFVLAPTRAARVRLPGGRGRRGRLLAVRRHAAACRSARSARRLLFALRFGVAQHPAVARPHRRQRASSSTATSVERARARAALPARSTAIRTSW